MNNFSHHLLSGMVGTEIWSEKVPNLYHLVPIWPTFGSKSGIPVSINKNIVEREQFQYLFTIEIQIELKNTFGWWTHWCENVCLRRFDVYAQLVYSGMSDLASNWARLAPNGTNLGLYKNSFLFICSQGLKGSPFKIIFLFINQQKTDL